MVLSSQICLCFTVFLQPTIAFQRYQNSFVRHSVNNRMEKRNDHKKLHMVVPADVKIRVSEFDWKIIPDIWDSMAEIIPNKTMLVDTIHGDKIDLTFKQCNNLITTGSAAMQKLGLLPNECVSMFSENSYKWFIADQAIMKAGSHNSVRGALAPTEELHYIYENSKSVALIVESPNLLQQLFSKDLNTSIKGTPKFVIVLFSRGMNGKELSEVAKISPDIKVLSYEEWLAAAGGKDFKSVPKDPKSKATLVYTSGTTASPKGVILNHDNLMYQITENTFVAYI